MVVYCTYFIVLPEANISNNKNKSTKWLYCKLSYRHLHLSDINVLQLSKSLNELHPNNLYFSFSLDCIHCIHAQ